MSGTSQLYSIYRLLWSGLDLLFPPSCGGCGVSGSRWCGKCQAQVQLVPYPICTICGKPLSGRADPCLDCRRSRPAFHVLRSWTVFDAPVRQALHRLKYRNDIGLGDALAAQLAEFVIGLKWPVDLVVPVPLGRERLQERGYNQVSLIARPLSMAMNIAFAPDAIARVRETRSQVGLSKAERSRNVHAAFRANGSRVHGRAVLLIDDVATTGSTLSSCAEALCAVGARDVFAFTVSRALAHHGLDGV